MELTIDLPGDVDRTALAGIGERNLKMIREALGVTIAAREGSLRMTGDTDAVGRAAAVLEQLTDAARHGSGMNRQQVLEVIAEAGRRPATPATGSAHRLDSPTITETLDVYLPGRTVKPMTDGQKAYLKAIQTHDLTFCTGPAGTGKTYLATAAAASMLKNGAARKLVLVRPAVEAGERLGFLPGTMQEKVNPYLRPLIDALQDMMPFDQLERLMEHDVIEIVPLAFMRGRTLNDAVIILDEAQNTTRSQMLMFLTRLGHGSRMVVTGDTSQTDLEEPTESGLIDAVRRLQRVSGVATVTLNDADIVRHSLVQRVVEAYGPEDQESPDRQKS
ncbi:MAG: PhoH family protein [Phycisphaeraceae bacterium]|nr:PhoH family protein [Phycisphaeraceae bacterium]